MVGGALSSGERRGSAAAEAFVVFLIAVAARLPFMDHVPHKDELNHILAARAFLERGTFEIVAGADPYSRASGFTHLIAGMFRLFGESLVVARAPSVLFGALMAAALFVWVRSEAGRLGGWVAAVLMIFSPVALMLSQWARFYTLHSLLVLLAIMMIYRALSAPPASARSPLTLLAAAGGLLLFATHFQVTTLSVLPGLALWIGAFAGIPAFRRMKSHRQRLATLSAIALVAAAGLAWLVFTGTGARLLAKATSVDVWAESNRDNFRYYHYLLLEQYPTLWTLFPLAILVAAARRFHSTMFFAFVFGITFLVHSALPWKTERYIFHVLPLFFGLWGLAAGAALPWVRGTAAKTIRSLTGGRLPHAIHEVAVTGAIIGVALFAAFGSASTSYALKYMTVGDAEWRGGWGGYRGNPDWAAAGALLEHETERAEAVLVSSDISAFYGLGRVDYHLRPAQDKTTSGYITSPAAFATLLACRSPGLVIIERTHYAKDWAVTPELTSYIEARTESIELPEAWRLFAFRWTETIPSPEAGECEPSPPSRAAIP